MTLPAEVITAHVVFGPLLAHDGRIATGVIEVTPDAEVIWAATNESLMYRKTRLTLVGGVASFDPPANDQDGFIDGQGNEIKGWTYTARLVGLPGRKDTQASFGTPTGGVDGVTINVPLAEPAERSTGDVTVQAGVLHVNGKAGVSIVLTPADLGAAPTMERVDIRGFLLPGEELDRTGATSVHPVFQRAVDALGALYVADPSRAFVITVPDGQYRITTQLSWLSGVGVQGASRDGVVFRPEGLASFINGAYPGEGYTYDDCVFETFTVDGILQDRPTYSAQTKGIYIQHMRRARFENVTIRNTWATGFGVDHLQGAAFINCDAIGCGRGLAVLGRDPQISTGHSGLGIGTGGSPLEQVSIINARCIGNGLYGIFTEKQSGSTYFPSGVTIVGAHLEDNWIGFKDAGSSGLIAQGLQVINNKRAGIALGATPLVSQAGYDGLVSGAMVSGNGYAPGAYQGAGVILAEMALGGYTFQNVQIFNNHGPGIYAAADATPGVGTTFTRGRIFGNAGPGVQIDCATQLLALEGIRFANNLTADVAIAGATTDLTLTGCDVRSGGAYLTIYPGGLAVTDRNRGDIVTGAAPPVLRLADEFNGADAALAGRVAPDGPLANAWAVDAGTWGVSGGAARPLSGAASNAYIDLGVSDHLKLNVKFRTLLAGNSRRADMIFRYVDANNWWRVTPRPTTSVYTWTLQKMVAGVLTTVGTVGPLSASGDEIEVRLLGNDILWKVNGTTITTVTDAQHVAATRIGMRAQFTSDVASRWEYVRAYTTS